MKHHVVDMTTPDEVWEGYTCSDGTKHRDGTLQFYNTYCIACKALLIYSMKEEL